jgi:hypothetical protein
MKRRRDLSIACLAIGMCSPLFTGHSAATTTLGTVSNKQVDLCTIADTDTLQALIQSGIQPLFPIPLSSRGESIELLSPWIEQVSCPYMTIKLRAEVQYRQAGGPTPAPSSGSMILTSPMVGDLRFSGVHEATTVTAANLRQALALATNPQIIVLKLDNAPAWLGPSWIRACLNGEHAEWGCRDVIHLMRFDVTQLAHFYLQQGPTL